MCLKLDSWTVRIVICSKYIWVPLLPPPLFFVAPKKFGQLLNPPPFGQCPDLSCFLKGNFPKKRYFFLHYSDHIIIAFFTLEPIMEVSIAIKPFPAV